MKFEYVLRTPEGPRRTAAFTAWIQGLFTVEDEVPVLVGGAAVEIFTGGAYTTGDFDFVGSVTAPVRRALEANGFRRSGRHWINDEAEMFLEFPASSLGQNETSVRWAAFGNELVLVSLEDLLVDRLGCWAYWQSGVDGANAFALYRARRQDIDQERLSRRAREAKFEAALAALRAFDAEWSGADPDAASLEEWANKGPEQESR